MCTSIVEIVDAEGKGKDGNAWFKLSKAIEQAEQELAEISS